MLDKIIGIDRSLFSAINHLPHYIYLDYFFAFLSGVSYAGIVWFVIGIVLFIWEEKKERRSLLSQIIAGYLSITFVDLILKNLFHRSRPEFRLPSTIVVFDMVNSFSFPSGHATIAFAMAYILSVKHKKWSVAYFLLAFLIGFSRIYLGKHYPSDIVIGSFLGMCIGILSCYLSNLIVFRVHKK
jgi:undecaprenyl-diphosphatase